MKLPSGPGLALLTLIFLTGGCSSVTGVARVTPAPTQTERVIILVVTATLPPSQTPVIAVEPTITPLATLTPLANLTSTATATTTRAPTVRPPGGGATNTPRPATPTPPAFTYPAPNLLAPGPKDAKHTNEDIPFEWNLQDGRSLTLNSGECYLLQVTFTAQDTNKPLGGSFDTCTFANGLTIQPGVKARFVLNRPRREGPNYSSFVQDSTQNYDVKWCVSVVLKTGDQLTPLSPSACLSFPMLGS